MPILRSEIIDAAARVITRRGDHRMDWEAIASEAGLGDGFDRRDAEHWLTGGRGEVDGFKGGHLKGAEG